MRLKGSVISISVAVEVDYERLTPWRAISAWRSGTALPTMFIVRVDRLLMSDFKTREVIHHHQERRKRDGKDEERRKRDNNDEEMFMYRKVRTRVGLQVHMSITGSARRFSAKQLLSECVMKFGMLSLLTQGLEVLWQYVFPLVPGLPDYNALVYRTVDAAALAPG